MDVFSGITVLSLEQATVLPYLTYRLALDGMNVIRVEHPVYGDPNRLIGDNVLNEERMNAYFLPINGGKKAVTLNLAEPEGRELLLDCIRKLDVDIFATNQLPKNYDKLGVGYDALRAVKPDIIWLGITGFGPESNEVAYDPILQARSGLMELTGEAEAAPQVLGIPLPDMGASEHAYGLLMKALYKRARTGLGDRIDLAMFRSSVSWLTVPLCLAASFKRVVTRRGNTHEFFAPVSVFKTRDGYLYIAVGNDRQWESLTRIPAFSSLNRKEYAVNEGRIRDVRQLNRELADVMENHTLEELIGWFNQANVAASRINTIPEVLEEPAVRDSTLRSKDPRTGMEILLAPPPFDTEIVRSSDRRVSFPPRFGEHNGEIFGRQMGVSEERLSVLKERGII
ncbi:MAG: CoA transferase [Deltaproteobacteria bacterium]|nr:CoA transferase [Deltaproteobacteria bacterium]